MSTRQKTQKKPKVARDAEKEARRLPATAVIKNVGRAAALLLIAGIASPVSQLNLSPVYGSIPASLHHQRAMTLTAVAALISRGVLKKYVSARAAEFIAVIAYWTPVIQFLLFPYSSKLGIEYGPLIIEGLTYFPLLFLSAFAAGELLESIDMTQWSVPQSVAEVVVPTASYFTISSVAKVTSALIPGFIGTHIYFTRIGLQMLIGSAAAFVTPSRIILLAFPAILHTLWANPHHPSDHAFVKANATLFDNHNYTLLARQESVTGYVSVLENVDDSAFRILRCDHSLLGGEWLVTPAAWKKGQRQRETIFSVFVMLEAVRLIEPTESSDVEVIPDSQKSALNIGLGIGTAPNALMSHKINTTIVELDPVVHHYATKFFNLNPNHTAVIDDAVSYVSTKSISSPGSFHYIIHDVFTGGAEPVYLFTQEFMKGLYDLLTEDGVIAINYAGDMALDSTRLALNTIHSVFPACRIYRDALPAEDLKPGDPDFINMILLCVKNDHGQGKRAVKFREAGPEDWKGSIARHRFLQPQDDHEITYDYVPPEQGGKIMTTTDVSELEKYHKTGAVNHWKIMRTVLPTGVWETW
ncbi:S-adenosyl-L-methionine-dependent methyltransferase [Corynespora cassiicola Philippines]|uniref:S-adenosyl-L-methionine-dependent methyltransferase n=1 Tax=Corynespora cassiicola Philippines TaxID=1448308 RepID=A0A2T2N3G8_CORCC|nr:S-adenosyl-L-methionine-dependent methyltransferase [Corynespora cassiicola Philippines]